MTELCVMNGSTMSLNWMNARFRQLWNALLPTVFRLAGMTNERRSV